MKLSTRGRYGLRMMVDISLQPEKIVTLSSIAERQEVSVNYLEQVAKDLKRAGYLRTVKGPKGGYLLNKPAKEIVVGEALRCLEGDLLLTEGQSEPETPLQMCVRENVYEPLNTALSSLYDSITLQDLIKDRL